MKIAIIGSGISGLTAAYHLHRRHALTVFEAGSYVGGHTNTIDVEYEGERHALDTGFLVFNDRTYPHFSALLRELDVRSRPTSMSFSVRADEADLEYEGSSLNGLFVQRRNLVRPAFYRLLADIVRFNRNAERWVAAGTAASGSSAERVDDNEPTVAEFLAEHRFSREFADYYLLPMGAAIWSCPVGTFARFPIRFIVEFYRHHGLLDIYNRPTWFVVEGGSRNYVAAMTKGFRERIRLNSPVVHVRRMDSGVEVVSRGGRAGATANGTMQVETFDHVVFACHADQALALLADPTDDERRVLGAFPYERNTAVVHTDEALLPRRRRAWAAWNYLLLDDRGTTQTAAATVTYNLNILQHLQSKHTFNVSLNVEQRIDPARVLRRIDYMHPIFTTRRTQAQADHGLISRGATSYCGAYWGNGFHEDGVVSALRVVTALDDEQRSIARSRLTGSLR